MDIRKSIFSHIEKVVKTKENYIPRAYQTVGGIWTVDTYKKGEITLQVMDEGWSTRIFTNKIDAIETGRSFKVNKGSIDDFVKVFDKYR